MSPLEADLTGEPEVRRMGDQTATSPASTWTEERLRAIADRVLGLSSAEATQVSLVGRHEHLTRFANNQIHQNVSEHDMGLQIQVAFGQKVGRAGTNDVSTDALAAAVKDAEALALAQPDNPLFSGFSRPLPLTAAPATFARTIGFTPADRAKVAMHVCRGAANGQLTASGAFTTGLRQYAIANSHGVWAYHQHTLADFNTVVMSDDSSGWAAETHLDAGAMDGEKLAHEAIAKAERSRHPQSLAPGTYTVILEPYAVNDLLQYLAFGFGADDVREGRSFMSGREGERLIHPELSIWDDGFDPAGIPFPFDFEGTPKQKATFFDRGQVGRPVYDLRTAARENRASTGHHSGGSAFWGAGPQAWNLFMSPGKHSPAEMLAATERGIWVTRFHYCNRLDPRKTTLTGMTRDGTFWIEDGVLAHPLQNLRFTHAILDALRDVDMIGRETKLELNWFGGGNRSPALRIQNFRFSGKTLF